MSKQEEMFGLVEELKASGLSVKAFSKERGLKYTTFEYWVRKKREREQPGSFIKVDTSVVSTRNESVELTYPNGIRIKIAVTDLSLIDKLIKLY